VKQLKPVPNTRWSLRDCWWILVAVVVVNYSVTRILTAGLRDLSTVFFTVQTVQTCTVLLAAHYVGLTCRCSRMFSREAILCGFLWGFILFLVVMLITRLVLEITGVSFPLQPVTRLMQTAHSWRQWLAFTLIVLVIAPVGEEIYFRGLLFPVLQEKVGDTRAIFLTAIIFALCHREAVSFLPLVAAGILLTWLFGKFSNLLVPIMAHGIWNGLVLGYWLSIIIK
jgi:membrane protease YdiL (CAAX protease family)